VSLRINRLEIDSAVAGMDVYECMVKSSDVSFLDIVAEVQRRSTRSYIVVKVPASDLTMIQAAEDAGFRFAELQYRTAYRIRGNFDTSRYAFDYVRVQSQSLLDQACDIAKTSIVHDRVSLDPALGSGISGARYVAYLKDSFARDEDEIWAVKSRASGHLLTFRSYRRTDESTVNLLIGGVHPDHKNSGLGVISSHFCFNQLHADGVRKAFTHVSAANLPILNLEVGHFGFRVTDAHVVLRHTLCNADAK